MVSVFSQGELETKVCVTSQNQVNCTHLSFVNLQTIKCVKVEKGLYLEAHFVGLFCNRNTQNRR